jgi:hypothetical protein
MNPLHYVTYGCTVVTHGASQRCRQSTASQSRARFATAIRFFTGCRRQDGSRLLRLPTSSLSISSTSRAAERRCSDRGCEDCFHREAFRSVGRAFAFIRGQKRLNTQRSGEPCAGGVSAAKEEAWVNGHQVGATGFSWNIGLIVCYRQNWNRFMVCWCPTSDGQSTRQRLRRN